MFESILGYILQGITILATLILGIYTATQSRKLQRGQNVVSVTTTFRLQRSEQIKQAATTLLSNSAPELLDGNEETAYRMLQTAIQASCQLSTILHRSFDRDMELILLSETLCQLIAAYIKEKDTQLLRRIVGYRKIFTIKCDMYTYAEWNRIKKETSGIDTLSEEWMKFYEALSDKYLEELESVYKEIGLREVR